MRIVFFIVVDIKDVYLINLCTFYALYTRQIVYTKHKICHSLISSSSIYFFNVEYDGFVSLICVEYLELWKRKMYFLSTVSTVTVMKLDIMHIYTSP